MNIKIKRLTPDAKIPTYGSAGAAAFDIYTTTWLRYLEPGDAETLPTGIAVEVPEGHVMLVFSRSGHGFTYDVRLSNCVGVIDSDYRGEIMVRLRNDGDENLYFDRGSRIAQAMILPCPQIAFMEAETLGETERGTGGFGSTGM
jgi:dUTP pyrophosphatase